MATSKLDRLIVLHQVEILREKLLIHIKEVQSDLTFRNTHYASSIDTVIANATYLKKMSDKCFKCHHSEDVSKRLNELSHIIDQYKESLSILLTMRANRDRTEIEFNTAFRRAEKLSKTVNDMVHIAGTNLYAKTESSLKDISHSKIILYALVVITPFFAAGLGYLFIKELTGPVEGLLKATRKIKGGDLDYRVDGLKDEFGEVAASFNEMSDSLKQNMREIEESEKRYRTLFESAGDAIFILEAEGENAGKIVAANHAAAEMHGYTVDELLALSIQDLDTPDAAKEVEGRIQRIVGGEWINAEITHRKKDGTCFPVEISAGLLQFMDHKYILAFDRDISDRKKMENQILQSKLDWEDTFNNITDMITIHDKEFNIIRANKAAEEALGLPPLEVTKPKCYKYYHGKESPPEECPSCECFQTKKTASFEMFEPHLDMFLEIRAMPRFDNNNQMIGIIHVIRDITERKRVEEALQRAEQMKMVGELATGLAHEIKNPLAGIKASVEILAKELNISEEDRSIVKQAIDEIRRIELLLKSLLNFAKPAKPKLTVVDINDILDKTISFALKHPSFSSNTSTPISASKDFDKNLPEVLADPVQMQQVFLNLLINAVEAMPEGGILGMKTCYDAKPNSVQIMISDTGTGINKDMISNIFQPFFTTKRKGTGLGLAITRRLVEQNGGQIRVESNPGNGTMFIISFHLNGLGEEHLT
jgi:PAS domain S-box-containing protein